MIKAKAARILMAFLLMAAMVFSISCANEKKDWDRTRAAHTMQGYEAFLKEHPKSLHANEAKTFMEQIAFEAAKSRGTIEAYQHFLRKHPEGTLPDQAYTRIQELSLGWSFKVILTRILNTATALGHRWEIKDKIKDKGVAILLETKGTHLAKGISTSALFAVFESDGEAKKSLCSGLGLGIVIDRDNPSFGAWFFGEQGAPPGISMLERGEDDVYREPAKEDALTKEIWLLYGVPKEVKKMTLFYNDIQIYRSFSCEDIPHAAESAEKNLQGSRKNIGAVTEVDISDSGVESSVERRGQREALKPAETPRPDEEAPVRAMGEIKPPNLITEVAPVYPESAKLAQVEGVVILEITTDTNGRVVSCKVLRSIPLLDQAAIDAVRQWVYEPVIVGGKPRNAIFSVTLRFRLPK